MQTLSDYQKKKDWLICVDSDGCAMDTMDIKHIRCFGPCMVEQWQLQQWQDAILTSWNDVNLYTMTRGINRFKGLSVALKEVNEKYCPVDGVEALCYWADHSDELSNEALIREIEAQPDCEIFQKALSWSKAVNIAIQALPESEINPFENVKAALAFAHKRADVAIVSSANLGAVLEEWKKHGLLEHTDIVLAQNSGSKAFCIGELLKKGYAPHHVLMCGDAPGDLKAAKENNVFYYPILVRSEKESWAEFIGEGFDRLLAGSYSGTYQEKKIHEFLKNLGGENE